MGRIRTAFPACRFLLCLGAAAVVAATSLGGIAHGARGIASTETSAQWVQAFNEWTASHGSSDRIVAFIERRTRNGVHYVDIEVSTASPKGTIEVCGSLAVSRIALRNPDDQIVGGRRTDCAALRGVA